MIFLVAEEPPYRSVERRPPGLLAGGNVALDLEVTAACGLRGGTVARFPGDRDGAWPPCMVEAALGRPGHVSHVHQ